MFLLLQNEGYSPGESISGSSEKLLQSNRGKGQHICGFGEGGVHVIKHMFFAEGFCKSHGAVITMKDLGAF